MKVVDGDYLFVHGAGHACNKAVLCFVIVVDAVKAEDVEEPPPDLDMKFAALTRKQRSNPPVFKQGAMPERDEATDDTIELLQVQRKFGPCS